MRNCKADVKALLNNLDKVTDATTYTNIDDESFYVYLGITFNGNRYNIVQTNTYVVVDVLDADWELLEHVDITGKLTLAQSADIIHLIINAIKLPQ